MADLSKIKLNGTEYDLKDAVARAGLENIPTKTSDLSNDSGFLTGLFGTTKENDIDFPYVTPDNVHTALLDNRNIIVVHTDNTFQKTMLFTHWDMNINPANGSYTVVSSILVYYNLAWFIYELSGTQNTWNTPKYDVLTTYDYVESLEMNKANISDLPLIVTGTCAFGTSLINGTDAIITITNVSHTVAQIATAVTANRPIYFVLTNNNMKIMLQYSAYDGSTYYFTNAYDPFTQTAYDNESFNITVIAKNENSTDSFTYVITYNKNAFVTQSAMTSAINTAIGGITEFDTQVVQSLPQTGIEGTIYFTPNNHGANDVYDEFIYVNNAWEKIGNTQVDLSGYARTNDLALVATSGDYNNLNNTPDIPENTSDLTNDSGFITLAQVPTELPAVSASDNDKVLTVENGTWTAKTPAIQFSGDYNDLTNKPTLFDGNYNSLSNKPTLFSGDYNDLTNKPTIPSATTVTQTITSGVKIAEINGTAIYAPAYANGDQIAY